MAFIIDPSGATRTITSSRPLTELIAPELVCSAAGGSASEVDDNGVMVETTTSGAFALDSINFTSNVLNESARLINLSPSLVDIVGDTLVVKDGITSGFIEATWIPEHLGPRVKFYHQIIGRTTSVRANRYAAGEDTRTITDAMVTVLDAGGATPDLDLFSSPNIRNPGHWAAAFDFTGCCTTTSRGARGGAAITPRHVAFAKHWGAHVNDIIYFVAADNSVISRTVVAIHESSGVDRRIALLNADLPASITPLKVLGTTTGLLPLAGASVNEPGILAFWADQNNRLYLTTYAKDSPTTTSVTVNSNPYDAAKASFYHPTESPSQPKPLESYPQYGKAPVNFDSGSPAMMLIDGSPHLAATWTSGVSGPSYVDNEDLLNDIILELDAAYGVSTGHTVTVTDF